MTRGQERRRHRRNKSAPVAVRRGNPSTSAPPVLPKAKERILASGPASRSGKCCDSYMESVLGSAESGAEAPFQRSDARCCSIKWRIFGAKSKSRCH